MFISPRAAAVGLAPIRSIVRPVAPVPQPKTAATPGVTWPDGNGRLFVRFIRASRSLSIIWLNVLADAALVKEHYYYHYINLIHVYIESYQSPVPRQAVTIPNKSKVGKSGIAATYPAPEVNTTSELNRNLDKEA